MLIPRKNEDLHRNVLVLGADVIQLLKRKPYNLEALYQELKRIKDIGIARYYDVLTVLWMAEIIELKEFQVYLKGQ